MKPQKSLRVEGSEVIAGGQRNKNNNRKPGITPIEQWEGDFSNLPSFNNIEKLLEFPPISDMAGVLARANFKDDQQRIAAVRLAYKHRKFNDDPHQELLRDFCASTLGTKGLGKILQTFIGTNLLAPDMLRAVFGMPRSNNREEVHRGRNSDLRADGVEKER